MLRSKSRPASPSTSPIPAVHGKEAATRTRTDSFVSTSLRAQICHGGVPRTSKQSPGRSTAVRARRSVGRRRQRRSTNSYSPFNNQVLLRSVESGQYRALSSGGLCLVSPSATETLAVPVVDDPGAIDWRDDDVVCLCMKSQDSTDALAHLLETAGPDIP